MYNKQVWKDEIPDLARPILDGSGKQKTDPQTGRPLFELVQEGTRITSTRLNTMEGGIEAAHTLVEQLAKELGGNFVAVINGVMGLQCSAQGLTVTWTAGVAYVGGRRFEVSAGNMPLNPTQGQYLYVDTDGIVKKTTSQATAKAGVLLFYVATDSSGVISSMDQRLNISMEEILKKIDSTATTAALDATAKAEAARVSAKTYTDDQVKGIADKLDTVKRQDVVLNAGMQILNAQRRAAFSLSGIKGRTLVNLLGRDGAFENVNPWTAYSVKGAPTVVNNEITVIGSGEATNPQISRNLRAAPAPKVGDKMFIRAIAKTKNACESLRAYLYISSPVSTRHGEIIVSSPTVDKPYALYKSFTVTQQLVDNWGTTGFILAAQHASAAAAKDTVAVYSQAALYAVATQDLGLTDDELAAKYTYVNSLQPVRNPYAIRYGENLAQDYPEAKINFDPATAITPFTVIGTYEVKFSGESVSTNVDKGVYFDISTIPGQTYTAAVDTLADNGFIRFEYWKDRNSIGPSLWVKDPDFFPSNAPATATVPPDCTYMRVYYTNQTTLTYNSGKLVNESLIGGNYHFKNWRLFPGPSDLGFKPREDSMLALQTDLYADPLTGANADEVFEKEGQYFKLAKWKKQVLDGSVDWRLNPQPRSGYKEVYVPGLMAEAIKGGGFASKFDGKILTALNVGAATTEGDQFLINSDNAFVLAISNTDSGWGDNYTPTADEIKAYFMGYKMYPAGGSGSAIYTGSGTKAWVYRTPSGLDGWQDVGTTLPTSSAPINAYWQPYQLVYQLATPTVEPIVSEGMLTFNEGDNQIEVGTGLVVREAIRLYDGEQPGYGAYYYTNHATIGGGSKWKYKPMKVLAFYRNSLADGSFDPPPTGSDPWYRIKKSLYDSSVTYSVTYLMLDNSPIVPFTGSYAINEKAMLQELTETVQQNATAVSVLMNKKADKDQTIVWITPTLLNGWTSFGSNTVQYGKDAIGNVHIQGMAGGGAGEQPMFILPVGFRPKRTRQCVSIAVKDGVVSAPTYEIAADGKVIPYGTIAPTWMTLDTITPFPAER
ncbi:hypothetical protein [Paenibacillus sp. FSL M8-0142]|uniref:hypothetical protein n=1 Tax=Paenibacillus sp. FSL M8-0142 TaxID=2954525 RepID=UPI00315AEF75